LICAALVIMLIDYNINEGRRERRISSLEQESKDLRLEAEHWMGVVVNHPREFAEADLPEEEVKREVC